MFDPSREQARRFFIETWRKFQAKEILSPLEDMAARCVVEHPEYHALLDKGEEAVTAEFSPESGRENPFLHLSLHLTIEEQLSIDQPPGIKAAFQTIFFRTADRHATQHIVMECLGEILWHAQKNHTSPDGQAYITCVRRHIQHRNN